MRTGSKDKPEAGSVHGDAPGEPSVRRLSPEGRDDSHIAEYLASVPEWWQERLALCRVKPKHIRPTCTRIAHMVYGTASRWREVEPHIKRYVDGGAA
jgi:hypothetical protein